MQASWSGLKLLTAIVRTLRVACDMACDMQHHAAWRNLVCLFRRIELLECRPLPDDPVTIRSRVVEHDHVEILLAQQPKLRLRRTLRLSADQHWDKNLA